MRKPKPLDDDYVRKYARAGEDWQSARERLECEVFLRYCQLPVCVTCAAESSSLAIARHKHGGPGMAECHWELESWPAEALSPRLFDAAHAQSGLHARALAALARGQVQLRLALIDDETHPINALLAARELVGYLGACRGFDLFDNAEWSGLSEAAHAAQERARLAFIALYLNGDPLTVPWRAVQNPESQGTPT